MRYDAPFIIMRLAPTIGRPHAPRRITVQARAYTLEDAMTSADGPARRRRALQAMFTREGDSYAWISKEIAWLNRCATWIERSGAPARVPARGRGR